jgi:tryptophan 7-halogenase
MRVGIVGGGTGGVVTAASICSHLPKWCKVDCIYDPNLPTFGVGEALNHSFVQVLRKATNYSIPFDLEESDARVKHGIMFSGWSDKDGYIPLSVNGLHMNTFKLRDFVFKRLHQFWSHKFSEIHGKVLDISQSQNKVQVKLDDQTLIYDYIFDCRGVPEIDDTYEIPDSISVNSVILNVCDKPCDLDYTYHIAHKDGWMFGIPINSRSAWGYLFNRNITDKKQAVENCSELLRTHEISKYIDRDYLKENIRILDFDHYYSKKCVDNRIIRNGNRLYTFEPLHGYAVPIFLNICEFFLEYIFDDISEERFNQKYRNLLSSLEELICFHYHKGSIYDTEFWRYAKERSLKRLEGSEIMKLANDKTFTRERAVTLENIWTTTPSVHPYFLWEIDLALQFNYFNHFKINN